MEKGGVQARLGPGRVHETSDLQGADRCAGGVGHWCGRHRDTTGLRLMGLRWLLGVGVGAGAQLGLHGLCPKYLSTGETRRYEVQLPTPQILNPCVGMAGTVITSHSLTPLSC